ncbi:hypothetical protein APS56_16205 [Pseudalgibacter alginicilyticus]|uniref:DUF4834 domain-containing protein n=2 Tax=Pseudalgibacter alginicilyticus TaxID=1736674 RepID=A0A0P0D7G6_9FLAO|nr:DUF4834 family protein [Pseudalgibacter alginicilyticus]ALJ06879.1 hypothetical protein APS56_16205 [Pseudalgibacter alginicilyticus]
MLQYASATGLVRTILIILLIYFGVKILSRLLTPFLIKYVSKKAEQRFGGQFGGFQKKQETKPKKEGEVTIDKMPNMKSSNKDVGDYVDYEEID